MKGLSLISVIALMSLSMKASSSDWTWLYEKKFDYVSNQKNQQLDHLLFEKKSVAEFSQLIVSWNAFRPKKGHFVFYLQTRDKQSQQWGDWHKMMAWGNNFQRSFSSKDAQFGWQYLHVRFEADAKRLCDAFRVKVMASDGACLQEVKSLAVNAANYYQFTPERHEQLAQLSSVYVGGVPKQSQYLLPHPKNKQLCSPTSCSLVVNYLTKAQIEATHFAEKVFDEGLQIYGHWPFNTAQAFHDCKGDVSFAVARLSSFEDVHKRLQKGLPVVVSVRGELAGAPSANKHGHLLVVVGWNQERKKVLCHDPAGPSNEQTVIGYDVDQFLTAWERSRRLAYLAHPTIAPQEA